MMMLSKPLLLILKDMFVGGIITTSITSISTFMSMAKIRPQWTTASMSKLLMEWNIMGFFKMLLSYAMLAKIVHIRRYCSSVIGLIQSTVGWCQPHKETSQVWSICPSKSSNSSMFHAVSDTRDWKKGLVGGDKNEAKGLSLIHIWRCRRRG